VSLRSPGGSPRRSPEVRGHLRVTVVICTFTPERWDRLLAAVAGAQAQDPPPDELLIVLDHVPELRDRANAQPGVRVVANTGPRGLSSARNRGIEAATGDLVVFLDDDAVPQSGWLAAIAAAFEDPRVLAAGGRAEPDWEGGRPGWFPEEFDWVVGCSYRGQPTVAADVRNLLGSNMGFRRELFGAVGGFREDLGRVGSRPVGGEETELCIRLRAKHPDASIRLVPEARVLHHVPGRRRRVRYFIARCWSEGVSKAQIARAVGSQAALAAERRHAARALPSGIIRSLLETVTRRDVFGPVRAGAILIGLVVTAAGYARGRLAHGAPPPPPTLRMLDDDRS